MLTENEFATNYNNVFISWLELPEVGGFNP